METPLYKKTPWELRKELFSSYLKSLKRPLRIILKDPLALAGTIIILFLIMVAILAPFIATHDPHRMQERIEGNIVFYREGGVDLLNLSLSPLNAVQIMDGIPYVVGDFGQFYQYREDWLSIPLPSNNHLYGIDLLSPDTGLMVGEKGETWFFKGDVIERQPTPVTEDLLAVQYLSEDFALAVGRGGTVLRWDGEVWHQIPSPVNHDLYSLSLISQDLGFIAGARGTILRYSQGLLTQEILMSFRDFYGIDLYNQELGLAVGERGTMFRFDGNLWRQEYGPESRELRDVHIHSKDRILVIGMFGILLEYHGMTWKRIEIPFRRHFRGVAGEGDLLMLVGSDPFINELAPPSRDHLFGTTHLGRDIFSQTVYGTRTALFIGILTALFVNIIGVNVGLIAGYFKGKVDDILMRIVDVMYALPFEPFAMILVMVFNPSIWIVILSIGLLTWRTNARVIRSQVLSLSGRPFVKAARVAGSSHARILYVHIAPNILPLAFLQLAVAMGYAITAEATLSFLGLGPPRIYSWGTILHAARLSGAWRTAWWWIVPPGFLIMITVVSVFFIARALEILTNPRLEGELKNAGN